MTGRPESGDIAGLRVHEDITRAATLPGWVYASRAVFEAQRTAVFHPSWQLLAGLDQVRTPGSAVPLTLLEGCLDEPVLLTRDQHDRLHCLSNVCTHRAALVCEHPGVSSGLRCRYHGRRFGLDGRFLSMPEFEEACDFPSPADNLRPIAHGACGPLLFASLDPDRPLDSLVAPLLERCAFLPLEAATLDTSRSRDYSAVTAARSTTISPGRPSCGAGCATRSEPRARPSCSRTPAPVCGSSRSSAPCRTGSRSSAPAGCPPPGSRSSPPSPSTATSTCGCTTPRPPSGTPSRRHRPP